MDDVTYKVRTRGFTSRKTDIYIYIYIQVRYSVFYMHQYKLSCRYNAAYIGACKTRYIVHVYITVLLKMDPRV